MCPAETVRSARAPCLRYSPARSRWIARPAGQGFMSTQRRENGFTPATKTCRRGPRNRWRRMSCTGRAGVLKVAFEDLAARYARADASGGTAPSGVLIDDPSDLNLSPGTPARLATISLQSDYRIVKLVLQGLRDGSPPFGCGHGEETGTPVNHGSSFSPIPYPSGHARLHRTLPQVPAGRRRRAERYDVKGNLHLQHAA